MFQAVERAWWVGGEQSARAVCAVDVKPDTTLGADRADGLEIVERAGCRRAGGSHDCHDALALVPQAIERRQEQVYIELVVARLDRNAPSLSQSQLTDCARDRVVCVLAVYHEGRIRAYTFFQDVGQRRIPRRQH